MLTKRWWGMWGRMIIGISRGLKGERAWISGIKGSSFGKLVPIARALEKLPKARHDDGSADSINPQTGREASPIRCEPCSDR